MLTADRLQGRKLLARQAQAEGMAKRARQSRQARRRALQEQHKRTMCDPCLQAEHKGCEHGDCCCICTETHEGNR